MKTKTKLNLAVGLLLALILLLTILGSYYIFAIKRDTENILKANYNTLEYSRKMLSALDEIKGANADAVLKFEQNLANQAQNITESGEGKVTKDVQENFDQLKRDRSDESVKANIRQGIFEIMKLNMDALKKKSDMAKSTAETANWVIAIAGCLCFLIAFNLMVNLPNHIANPIRELTESIKEIARGNYRQRVRFTENNEFGDLAKSFNVMAVKLQEFSDSNLNRLLMEKKRIETLLDNMHDPVIGLDNGGTILSANDEALKIMGLKPENVIGKLASEVALRNDLLKSLIVNEMESPKAHPIKIFADGKESFFERENVDINIVPTGEDAPIAIGNFIILRNITVFKELDSAKTNFIATVSHELKTPIAAIKLSLNLLENEKTGSLNPDQQQLLESIGDDSRRLLKITGELLEMSQLETGNIQLVIGKSAVADIVSPSLEAVKTQAEQKSVSLVWTNPEWAEIRADKDKTSWVLINFLTNAIRYSPEKATIEISSGINGNFVRIAVKDVGQGIDRNYQTRIFDRYFRVPGSSASGTGLGLAISREFIEAQGGRIGVESDLGLGSVFWFELPLA